ncbi:hypothetical protein LEN26_013982 [Aphanomyces euteiches]|nr:hypothetical protein LEN26_013982 [Aphanomyces euteiches]
MESLAASLGSQHHFTTAYSPWSNGTDEVLNRQILRCLKTLMLERQLQPNNWSCALPAVQTALNHRPSDRIGGRAPVTAFTGIPAISPIRATILGTFEVVSLSLEDISAELQSSITSTAQSLQNMHRDMAETSAKRRRQAHMARNRRAKQLTFSVGDFVLVGAVCQLLPKLALQWRGPIMLLR